MSRHQAPKFSSKVQAEVARLQVLDMWLGLRLERLEQLSSFKEVLPDILNTAILFYKDAVRGLIQLTRAYMTDDVVNAWGGSYTHDVISLEDLAKFLCYCSVPLVVKRSEITYAVLRPLMENALCPYELCKMRFDEYHIKNKIAKVTNEAQKIAIDNCFGSYMSWLEEWCNGQYRIGQHFKYGELMGRKLRTDLNEIYGEISWLERSIKSIQDLGFRTVFEQHSTRDSLDSEPPPESRRASPLDQLKITRHRLACCRSVCNFTDQVIVFTSSGWRFSGLENSQEGRTIEVPT